MLFIPVIAGRNVDSTQCYVQKEKVLTIFSYINLIVRINFMENYWTVTPFEILKLFIFNFTSFIKAISSWKMCLAFSFEWFMDLCEGVGAILMIIFSDSSGAVVLEPVHLCARIVWNFVFLARLLVAFIWCSLRNGNGRESRIRQLFKFMRLVINQNGSHKIERLHQKPNCLWNSHWDIACCFLHLPVLVCKNKILVNFLILFHLFLFTSNSMERFYK